MNFTDLKSAFSGKHIADEASYQESVRDDETEPEVNPEEGDVLEVELVGSDVTVSAILTLDEFKSTEDGFHFRGQFDSVQSDDEFRSVMLALFANSFGLGFERDGYIYTGSCSVEDFTIDDYDAFEVLAVVHTDAIYKKKDEPTFDIDRYIQDTTQSDSDDEDIWDTLEERISGGKNILNRK